MGINFYSESNTVRKWLSGAIQELELSGKFNSYRNLSSLSIQLDNQRNSSLVIIDFSNPNSIEICYNLLKSFDHISLVGVGTPAKVDELIKYFKAGIQAYIDLTFSTAEVYNALRKSEKGIRFVSSSQQAELLDHFINNSEFIQNTSLDYCLTSLKSKHSNLTRKELDVIDLLVKGLSYKEIAKVLGTSTFVVNQRLKSIYKKLQVRSRHEVSIKFLAQTIKR
jgi:DNA-binding NarL/FixJ family response regulator